MGRNRFPIGLKFHHLTVIEYLGSQGDKNRHTRYKCLCDCGKEVIVLSQHIGKQKSCGCAPRNNHRYKSYNVSKEDSMKLVREAAFETNSSSTHSITMCSGSVFDDWKDGKLVFLEDEDKFFVKGSRELRDWYARCVLRYKCTYDWDTKLYSDGSATYTEDELFCQERLDSVSEEDISEYREDDWYACPLSYSEWVDYRGEGYELYEERNTFDGADVVAFGYYGNDY